MPVNVTSSRFTVQCRPGYDGGLPQRLACTVATGDRPYHVEASYNGSHDRAAVDVTGLRPSTQYVATVYASNAKGLSPGHVRVYVETAPNPKDPRVAGRWTFSPYTLRRRAGRTIRRVRQSVSRVLGRDADNVRNRNRLDAVRTTCRGVSCTNVN